MTLMAFVREHTLHNTSKSIEDGLRGKVLGGNEIDKVLLSAFLLQSISIESRA